MDNIDSPEPSEVYPACKASSDQAFENFKFQMERTLQLDTPLDADELAAAHGQAKTRALGDFDKDTGHFKGPVKNDIRQKLEGLIGSMLDNYNDSNKTKSDKKCSQLLQNLFEEIDEKVKDGSYAVPGGHKSYLDDREECKQLYRNEPSKGPAAEEVLQRYLKNKDEESRAIAEKDQQLLQEDRRHAESLDQDQPTGLVGLLQSVLGGGARERKK